VSDAARMKVDANYVPPRYVEVIVKDPEQEICFVLALWACAIMGYRVWSLRRGQKLLEMDLLRLPDGMKILPEDSRDYARQVEALPEEMRGELLPRALLSGLHRFGSTRNIQDVSSAIRDTCELEFGRLDAELSMVRYVAWAIPAIGFVGTVRGIGESLQQAHKAVEGDVSGVVAGLGIAFNSTLVALALSILVMFMLHQIQLRQERAVLDTEGFLDTHVVRQMLVR
ncbi:MAG: MotA/TolQ/ExbB proton channel family protein, partial [Steroidobacteraceae bacterium]